MKHAFEHAQVMLQNTPRIGVPGIPDARGEVETCAPWSELKSLHPILLGVCIRLPTYQAQA